ncbi:ATP-binding protein [Streptomyces sp. NPDC048290]|uniref:ATP-binding protein n=1 Tax=Streptomyces sp. NPDC048290 TaxID=3155811 RepID=UPI0034123432
MPNPPGLSAAWSVPADRSQVGLVRRAAGACLTDWGLAPMTDDVATLLSELLTNAVEHGGGEHVEARLSHQGAIVRIEVSDTGEGTAQMTDPGADQENGRGLVIVDSLALAWGTRRRTDGTGKCTWCTLKVPPPAGTREQRQTVSAPGQAPSSACPWSPAAPMPETLLLAAGTTCALTAPVPRTSLARARMTAGRAALVNGGPVSALTSGTATAGRPRLQCTARWGR